MSFIFMIMAVPFLSATGIYNPQVMHHGHCIAEPGSFDALYCSGLRRGSSALSEVSGAITGHASRRSGVSLAEARPPRRGEDPGHDGL